MDLSIILPLSLSILLVVRLGSGSHPYTWQQLLGPGVAPERAWRQEMGVGWMTQRAAREAVPPAMTEYLGAVLKETW